ncbi:unnamed protein product [Adineta steineri]|uniref:Uncharacterized protein n=1 Tax=Adineta steineri TaxID=433720 RepID=A0A820CQP4_9BILA|nr:unnamed protein product [Adineta steineri]CAF4225487.1 unnamed protein product [Adineta steineri]
MDQFKKAGKFIKTTAKTMWSESSTITKVCVIGSAAAVTAPLAVLPVLGVAGFTAAGVAAGSIAASIQTAATVSGSVFALCQFAAATGIVATSTSVGVGLASGATAGGATAVICRLLRRRSNNGENTNTETQAVTEEYHDTQEDDDDDESIDSH